MLPSQSSARQKARQSDRDGLQIVCPARSRDRFGDAYHDARDERLRECIGNGGAFLS
jgi:hypothetical protein